MFILAKQENISVPHRCLKQSSSSLYQKLSDPCQMLFREILLIIPPLNLLRIAFLGV